MTVEQMIQALSAFPKDAVVMTNGYEGGIQEAGAPRELEVWWQGQRALCGPWDNYPPCDDENKPADLRVVFIPR